MLSSGTQAADFIKVLYAELKSANMSNIAIACCDAEGWNDAKSMTSQIKSAGAESMLGIVTSHTYTSNFNGPISTTAKVWQTEYSDLNGGWTTACELPFSFIFIPPLPSRLCTSEVLEEMEY